MLVVVAVLEVGMASYGHQTSVTLRLSHLYEKLGVLGCEERILEIHH